MFVAVLWVQLITNIGIVSTDVSRKPLANVIHTVLRVYNSFPPPLTSQHAVALLHTHARTQTQRENDSKVMYWYEFTNGGVEYFP
jgi:hypothetical protein